MTVDEKLIEWQAGARLIGLLEAEREKVKELERELDGLDEPSGPHG
jgi:hypothetical protein